MVVWVWFMRDFWARGGEREGKNSGKIFKNILLLPCLWCSSLSQKIAPPLFSVLPKFPPWLLVPPLVFISRGGEDHLTPAMAQGKVGDGSCWQGMVSVSFFFHNACRVWLCGYGSCGIFGQGVEREKGRIAGKFSKISFFSPVSAFAGEKLHRAVQNGTVQFFFF